MAWVTREQVSQEVSCDWQVADVITKIMLNKDTGVPLAETADNSMIFEPAHRWASRQ